MMLSVKHTLWVTTRLAALLCLTFLCHMTAGAQPGTPKISTDTLNILFRNASVRIDFNFANNARVWQNFEDVFLRDYSHYNPENLRLDIYSGASPEGNRAHNEWLGEHRGQAVAQLVRKRLGGRVGNIVVHNEGPRWQEFYDNIAASNEPWRDEVLAILDQPEGTNPRRQDPRETKLRQLYGGRLWRKLQSYLAPLRSGASAVLSWQPARDTVVIVQKTIPAPVLPPVPPRRDTLVILQRDTVVVIKNFYHKDTLQAPPPPPAPIEPQPSVVRRPVWILRTNIPLLGTLTPHLQAEWSIDHRDRWSFNVEAVASWWTFAHNAYANEILYGSLELRYWLGNRKHHHTLDGFHIGLAAGGGYGDLEWKSKGYQFEVVMGFLNLGWQHRFGKRRQWAFDAGIGLGYIFAPYRRYYGSTLYPESHTERYDDHLMWQHTKTFNWAGTPHANISIGYVFNTRKGIYRRAVAVERDSIRNIGVMQREAEREQLRQQRDLRTIQWYSMSKSERKAARKAEKLKAKQEKLKAKQQKANRKYEMKKLKYEQKQNKAANKQSTKPKKTKKKKR